jgi:hypothetical protein
VNAGIVFNAAAIVISLVALAASIFIGARQVRIMRKSNSAIVAIELLTQECRREIFLASEHYVLKELRAEHEPDAGVDALPDEARRHVTRLAQYYSSLGMMVALDVVDQTLLISAAHYRVRRAWAILEPYVLTERARRKSTYMAYFEHLAAVAGESDLPAMHRELGLKKIGHFSEAYGKEFGTILLPASEPAATER